MKLNAVQELGALTLLKGLPLFAGCPEESLSAIVKVLDARDVLPAKVLMMDQEIGRTLYLLAKGSVSVWKRVGGEKKQLATLKAPNFFGERTMFEESPASALVKADERCSVLALERALFDQLAVQFPGLKESIQKNMVAVRLQRIGPVTPQHEGDS